MARTMPSTTIYRRAQVVVVEVPFSDLSGRIAKEDLLRVEAMLEQALDLSSGAAARRLR